MRTLRYRESEITCTGQAQWCIPIISILGRWWQKDCEFKASLDSQYPVRKQKTTKKKKIRTQTSHPKATWVVTDFRRLNRLVLKRFRWVECYFFNLWYLATTESSRVTAGSKGTGVQLLRCRMGGAPAAREELVPSPTTEGGSCLKKIFLFKCNKGHAVKAMSVRSAAQSLYLLHDCSSKWAFNTSQWY